MNNIEITEKQEVKLLEMCKILFPEYKDWELLYVSLDVTVSTNIPVLSYWDGINYAKQNHWFEFCMTHLANKIEVNYESFGDNIIGINRLDHPVDYLYEEFLKLKK